MKLICWRQHFALTLVLSLVLLASGCSDSGMEVRDELAPLVGTWRAVGLVLTNQADSEQVLDLIELGGSFAISILATGEYTATLTFLGMANIELGTVAVSGNQVTITPVTPPGPATQGTWSISSDILYIDGATEFDFDFSGSAEPADVHFELSRVVSTSPFPAGL